MKKERLFELCKKPGCVSISNLSGYCPNHKRQLENDVQEKRADRKERQRAYDRKRRTGFKY